MLKYIGFSCNDHDGSKTHVVLCIGSIVSIRDWTEQVEVFSVDCQSGEAYVITDKDDMQRLRDLASELISY